MTYENQHPIGSGFSATSSAADVLDGIDLAGRHAIVTGGYSGIGLETTRALVAAGATVSVPARRPDTAKEQLGALAGVEIAAMDLIDLDSVAAYALNVVDAGKHVDMVVASAGVMAAPHTQVGPGWEFQMAANHLGHYALINQLWPVLDGGSRVVSVSSRGHMYSAMRWEDPFFERTEYDKWLAYGQSKTADSLFAVHLDHLGREHGVRAFSLHPGVIWTPLARYLSNEELIASGAMDESGKVRPERGKSPQQGAATQVWAAASPQLDDLGGVYLDDVEVATVFDQQTQRGDVRTYAIDPIEADRLWSWSAALTGLNAFS